MRAISAGSHPDSHPDELRLHGVARPQTSEDGPRDAVQPSAERDTLHDHINWRGHRPLPALDHAENWKTTSRAGPRKSSSCPRVFRRTSRGPVHEHLAKLPRTAAASTAAASDVSDELAYSRTVADSMNAVAGRGSRVFHPRAVAYQRHPTTAGESTRRDNAWQQAQDQGVSKLSPAQVGAASAKSSRRTRS